MSDNAVATGANSESTLGMGSKRVGTFGSILMIAYMVLLVGGIVWAMAGLWPYPTPNLTLPGDGAGGAAVGDTMAAQDTATAPDTANAAEGAAQPRTGTAQADSVFIPAWLACEPNLEPYARLAAAQREPSAIPKCVKVFGWEFVLWDEHRLLYLVLLAGALGATIHALRSLSFYIGDRELRRSWIPYYIMLPFGGAAVAVVFYVVIRGGFSSPGADFTETNPFGFIAVAALVGLFSQSAILKLQRVAENIFERPEPAKDALGKKGGEVTAAVVERVERKAQVEGGREDVVQITGSGFADSSTVSINGRTHLTVYEGPTLLTVTLDEADLAVLDNGGELRISVMNGDKASNELVLK
jgi:hypothetical protein